MIRLFAILTTVSLLGGCSWFGSETGEKPAELANFDFEAAIKELWSVDIGSGPDDRFIRLEPVREDGTLYVSDTKGQVRSLDTKTGLERWVTKLDLEISGGVGLGNGLVLVASRKGDVVALDRQNGREQWRTRVSSEVLAAPAAAQGTVVVQSVDGRITALSAQDGKRIWFAERAEPALTLRGTGTPIILGDAALVGFATGRLVAFRLSDGKPLWDTVVGQPTGRTEIERLVDVDVPVLVVGRMLVAAAFQARVVAISIENGAVLWSRDISTATPLAADASNIYVTDVRGVVYALNRENGATVWRQEKMTARQLSAPVPVGVAIAVGDFEGYVHWLSREDGHLLARERPTRSGILSTPVADGSTIFVLARNASLSALRIDPNKR